MQRIFASLFSFVHSIVPSLSAVEIVHGFHFTNNFFCAFIHIRCCSNDYLANKTTPATMKKKCWKYSIIVFHLCVRIFSFLFFSFLLFSYECTCAFSVKLIFKQIANNNSSAIKGSKINGKTMKSQVHKLQCNYSKLMLNIQN